VVFKGANNQWYENYVGIVGGEPFAFHTLPQLLRDRNLNIIDVKSRLDMYIAYTLIAMTSVLLLVVCYLAVRDPDNQSLQVLTGLFGLLVGYLVGKRGSEQPTQP
jgi:hypothetical protein